MFIFYYFQFYFILFYFFRCSCSALHIIILISFWFLTFLHAIGKMRQNKNKKINKKNLIVLRIKQLSAPSSLLTPPSPSTTTKKGVLKSHSMKPTKLFQKQWKQINQIIGNKLDFVFCFWARKDLTSVNSRVNQNKYFTDRQNTFNVKWIH